MKFKCRECGKEAWCIGFLFVATIEEPSNPDTFYCYEHCDHDRCASIKERIEDGYFIKYPRPEHNEN